MTLTLPALLERAALAALFFPFPEKHFPLSPLTRRREGGKRGHQSCPSKMGGRFLLTLALLSVLLGRCQVSAWGRAEMPAVVPAPGGPAGLSGTVTACGSREKRGGVAGSGASVPLMPGGVEVGTGERAVRRDDGRGPHPAGRLLRGLRAEAAGVCQ